MNSKYTDRITRHLFFVYQFQNFQTSSLVPMSGKKSSERPVRLALSVSLVGRLFHRAVIIIEKVHFLESV